MVDFDGKAYENLEAARQLAGSEQAEMRCLANACASRAYYAAYLAVAHRAQGERVPFTGAASPYYRHDSLPEDAFRWRILDDEARDDLTLLRDRRVKADYWEDHVDLEEANDSVAIAEKLVTTLLGRAV